MTFNRLFSATIFAVIFSFSGTFTPVFGQNTTTFKLPDGACLYSDAAGGQDGTITDYQRGIDTIKDYLCFTGEDTTACRCSIFKERTKNEIKAKTPAKCAADGQILKNYADSSITKEYYSVQIPNFNGYIADFSLQMDIQYGNVGFLNPDSADKKHLTDYKKKAETNMTSIYKGITKEQQSTTYANGTPVFRNIQNKMTPSEQPNTASYHKTCDVYFWQGFQNRQINMMKERLEETCDNMYHMAKNHLCSGTIGTSDEKKCPQESFFLTQRANWCQAYVIQPEKLGNSVKMITLERKIDEIRQKTEYKEGKKKIEELTKEIAKLTKEKKDTEAKTHELKKEKANIEGLEMGLPKALANHLAYEQVLDSFNNQLNLEKLTIKTGTFNLDPLCIGQECEKNLIDDEETDQNLFNRIIQLLMGIIGTLAVAVLVAAGAMMVISRGDENAISSAKQMFGSTLLGLIIAFSAYIIVQFVISLLFGLNG